MRLLRWRGGARRHRARRLRCCLSSARLLRPGRFTAGARPNRSGAPSVHAPLLPAPLRFAVGGVLLTIPVVDAARAAGTAERETREELPGEVLESEVACPDKPMAATLVEGRFGTREVELGITDGNGHLVVDLVPFAIDEAEARQAPRMSLYVGDVAVGTIDLLPLADSRRHAADTEAWESARVQSCRVLAHSADCEGVRDYLEAYPTGEHAEGARKLLFAAEPKIPELRDDEKWKAAGAEACLAGQAEDACAMVAQYVETYPDGNHIDEAKKVLEKGKKNIKMNAARKRAQGAEAACNNACAAQCSSATNKEACIRACKKTEASCAH